jgi:hypothetical protein
LLYSLSFVSLALSLSLFPVSILLLNQLNMNNSQLIALAKAALHEEKKKKEARHELSEKVKVRQDVFLDYARHRLEGRQYKADPDHRETAGVMEWADKEAKVENRWLIQKIEGRSVQGAPEHKHGLPLRRRPPVCRSSEESDWI